MKKRGVMEKDQQGFTIVELLIVIVVIAILATVSVVAYVGIANKAYDTAVKSDLVNMAKKLESVRAETGYYPSGGRVNSGGTENGPNTSFPGFTYKFNKDSHGASIPSSLGYCVNSASGAGTEFRIKVKSKSGRFFEYNSESKITDMGTAWTTTYSHLGLCRDFGTTYSYSYANSSSGESINSWNGWANQ